MADNGTRTTVSRLGMTFDATPVKVNYALAELGFHRRPTEEEQIADPGLKWVPTEKGKERCSIQRKVAGKKQEAWLVWDIDLAHELKAFLAPIRASDMDAKFAELRGQLAEMNARMAAMDVTLRTILGKFGE